MEPAEAKLRAGVGSVSPAANLSMVLANCTPEDFEDGGRFYPGLHRQLREISEFYVMPLAAVVGAFAILSPRNSINGNLRSLVTCIHGLTMEIPDARIPVTTLNRNRNTALQILRGELEFSDKVKGEKVAAFRHNILFPHESSRVTIDGHMVCLMTGRRMTMLDALLHMRETGGYKEYERAFRRWAGRHVTHGAICNLQAVVWCAWRRPIESAKVAPFQPMDPREIRPYPFTERVARDD